MFDKTRRSHSRFVVSFIGPFENVLPLVIDDIFEIIKSVNVFIASTGFANVW